MRTKTKPRPRICILCHRRQKSTCFKILRVNGRGRSFSKYCNDCKDKSNSLVQL